MIEYDKANVLSSYPSLTEYEVATFLDKAYNALIAQKVTGNNVRKMGLETDVKVVEDLAPLIIRYDKLLQTPSDDQAETSTYTENTAYIDLPENQLYFVSAYLRKYMGAGADIPQDKHRERALPIQLVSHKMAQKFFNNAYNAPWIKIPIGYIEQNRLYIIYDYDNQPSVTANADSCYITYIKKPNAFAKDLDDAVKFPAVQGVYTMFEPSSHDSDNQYYEFECNRSMAEELISLAITYALENIESNRLATKLNMRGLES